MRFAGNFPHNAPPILSTSSQLSTASELHELTRSRGCGRQKRRSIHPPRAPTQKLPIRLPRARLESRAHAFGGGKRSVDIPDGAAPSWTSRSSRSRQKRIYRSSGGEPFWREDRSSMEASRKPLAKVEGRRRMPLSGLTIAWRGTPSLDDWVAYIVRTKSRKFILADHASERKVKTLLSRLKTMSKKEVEKLAKG